MSADDRKKTEADKILDQNPSIEETKSALETARAKPGMLGKGEKYHKNLLENPPTIHRR